MNGPDQVVLRRSRCRGSDCCQLILHECHGTLCIVAGRRLEICQNILSSILSSASKSNAAQTYVFDLRLHNSEMWTHPVVIYYCFGGTHSSVMAAAIHLKRLPRDRLPSDDEIRSVPNFNCELTSSIGTVHHMGMTDEKTAVKAVGLGADREPLHRILLEILSLLSWQDDQIVTMETLSSVGWMLRLGGFLSCRLGWRGVSWPLVAAGARRAHLKLGRQVQLVRYRVQHLT